MKLAVVIFSGGQDSTTCLVQALTQYDEVHCVTFDYGQRHWMEIEVAKKLAIQLGVYTHKVIDTSPLNTIAISSLTRKNLSVPDHDHESGSLPSTFVPGRNILFITLAAIYAYQIEAKTIITGICETDYSGYPDCRYEFVKAINKAVNLGMAYNLNFITPLMWLNKEEIWAMADYYQQLNCVRYNTLTCYNGIIGEGCGHCDACYLRNRGLENYQKQPDVIMAQLKNKTNL